MRNLLIVPLLLCTLVSFSQKKVIYSSFVKDLPVPNEMVNDFGGFLTFTQITLLNVEGKDYLSRTGNAIVIVTLDSLTDPKTKMEYSVEEAARLYFNTWGIGDKEKNNGILILASRHPRRLRIEVGQGLSGVLYNSFCQGVIDNTLVPAFKKGDFFTGFKEAVAALEDRIGNPPTTATDASPAPAVPANSNLRRSYLHAAREDESSEGGALAKNFFTIMVGVVGVLFVVILLVLLQKDREEYYSSAGPEVQKNRYRRNRKYSSFNESRSERRSSSSSYSSSSSSSRSSSSSSSSRGYGGGSSSGGGASGSW